MVKEMRGNEMTGLEQGGERAEEGNESGQLRASLVIKHGAKASPPSHCSSYRGWQPAVLLACMVEDAHGLETPAGCSHHLSENKQAGTSLEFKYRNILC